MSSANNPNTSKGTIEQTETILLELASLTEQAEDVIRSTPALRARLREIARQLDSVSRSVNDLPTFKDRLRSIAQRLLDAADSVDA